MKRLVSTVLVLAATLGWLAVLFAWQPFDRINNGMDRAFGALPAWTQVENMYRDPSTQEVSRGDHPLESFRILQEAWAAHPGAGRIMLMGNSQTQMTSLAAGEPPPTGPEKTYTDQVAEHYREAGWQKLFYRLSAGALSYQEMLWYAGYLALKPEIKPTVLLVQLNYQNFANSSIRGGMLELLSDAGFRQEIAEWAHRDRAEAGAFAEALHHFEEGQHATDAASGTSSGKSPDAGYRLETAFREELDRVPAFERRATAKQSFVYMLYRCRSYILHLEPASKRSLGGVRVLQSRAALEDLVELCSHSGIRVIFFQAPTNPAVPLYGTPEDDVSYHAFTNSLGARNGLTTLDFEHSIPAEDWGKALNVPDPLHLSREGHRLLATLLLAGLRENGL